MKKLLDPFVYLFWASQVWILTSCPALQGLVLKLGMKADRHADLWIKIFFQAVVRMPYAFFLHIKEQIKKQIVLPRVAFSLTTKCTLNCDKCLVHVPDIKNPEIFSTSGCIKSLETLLSCVDHIYMLQFSGGEPFLHPEIDKLIAFCQTSPKIRHLDIITNGTIIPNEKTVRAIRKARASVRISRYPRELQPNVEKLKAILTKNNIFFIHEAEGYWNDLGNYDKIQAGSPKRRFSLCYQRLCLVFFRGRLHLCTGSAVLREDEKNNLNFKDDYIDLNEPHTPQQFRARWRKLCKLKKTSACSYCLGTTYETQRIPVAVQRKKEGNRNV